MSLMTPAQQEKYELRMNKTKLVDAQDNSNMLNAYQQEQPAPVVMNSSIQKDIRKGMIRHTSRNMPE